jgi:hypothetical protein
MPGSSRFTFRPLTYIILGVVSLLIFTPYLLPSSTSSYLPSLTSSLLSLNPASPGNADLPLTLEARLSDLLSRPVLDHWEAELTNRYHCPFYTYTRNTYFFHHQGNEEKWRALDKAEIRKYRNKIVEYLRGVESSGGHVVWEESMERDVPINMRKGIIMTGGDLV